MSSSAAIAAVTATLHELMEAKVHGAEITILPPDVVEEQMHDKEEGVKLNIYLYQIAVSAARRNDFSTVTSPGNHTAADGVQNVAPLALNLYYLLTAFGPTKTRANWESQRVLGRAMNVLNDQPLMTRAMVRAASTGSIADARLDEQDEMVRFTLHTLSLDEMYKIWAGFQKPYRLSVAYEASVILIDSKRPPFRAMPILTRGGGDSGVLVGTGALPRLDLVRFPERAKSPRGRFAPALLMIYNSTEKSFDLIRLIGEHLNCKAASVQFRPAVGGGVIERPAFLSRDGVVVELTPTRPKLKNPDPPADTDSVLIPFEPEFSANNEPPWHPGFYSITFTAAQAPQIAIRPGMDRIRSNALVVPVAPRIVGKPTVKTQGDDLLLECDVQPPVIAGQHLTAIVQNQSVSVTAALAAGANPGSTIDHLQFTIPRGSTLGPGQLVQVRLRVDEVENLSLGQKTAPDGRTQYLTFGGTAEVTIG